MSPATAGAADDSAFATASDHQGDEQQRQEDNQPRKKTRRTGQACDRCRSRKIKVFDFIPLKISHQNTRFHFRQMSARNG